MFRFTQTIIRELQPAFCQSYNIDSNIQVVVGVFSIMAAHFVQSCCACVLCTVQNETVIVSAQCIIHTHNRTERNMQPNTEYSNNDLFIGINIVTLAKSRL